MANATVKSAKRRSDFFTAVPFMLPALIGLTVFVIAPGIRGIYAGRLRNCGQVEAMTANLISMNRRYKSHAGLRVTDV